MAERMAINAPIQGTNVYIIKIAMKRIDDEIGDDADLILQVHDELVYEIKKEKAEKVAEKIKTIMESIIDPKDIKGIKCIANAAIGTNWGDSK